MKQNKYSDLKIVGFPEKIQSFKEDRVTAPLYVRIKPINRCMHACSFCTYSDGTKRKGDRSDRHLITHMHEAMNERDVMPTDKALELLDDLKEIGAKAVTFSGGGEPLMHQDITAIMRRTLGNGLDLSIITNGQALKGERAELLTQAKWVRVSIDYTTAEQMAASRNVPERFFYEILENLEAFAKAKPKNCDLGVNYIVTRYNYNGLAAFAEELKSRGVENVRFSPVYVQGFEDYHRPIALDVENQLRAMQTLCDDNFSINTTYVIDHPSKKPSRPFTRCLYAQTVPVVGADLGVYACHNSAYSHHGRIGSIANQRFKDLWFSDEAKTFFHSLNPSKVCNHECANHSKVVLFNQLADSSQDNFV